LLLSFIVTSILRHLAPLQNLRIKISFDVEIFLILLPLRPSKQLGNFQHPTSSQSNAWLAYYNYLESHLFQAKGTAEKGVSPAVLAPTFSSSPANHRKYK
jgi:hypothetical protein